MKNVNIQGGAKVDKKKWIPQKPNYGGIFWRFMICCIDYHRFGVDLVNFRPFPRIPFLVDFWDLFLLFQKTSNNVFGRPKIIVGHFGRPMIVLLMSIFFGRPIFGRPMNEKNTNSFVTLSLSNIC